MTNTHESRRCWSCGVDQHPKRPARAHFASEPEWLVASLTWLDFTFPQRQQHRDRVQEWERLREETELEAIAARVRDLLSIEEWTDEQQDEADRLAAEYMERRAAARAQRSTTKESTTRS